MSDDTIISIRGLRKSFPGVQALRDVSLDIRRGACHALMGENGAGKSTLGKILAGLYTADAGDIRVDGRLMRFRNPAEAVRAGIGMVHQELLFCENLTVAENLCLGSLPRRGGFLSRSAMVARARQYLATLAADVDPLATVGELSISQQQLVQIAAAVGFGAKILIFDEPTSSLSQPEAEQLFTLMARLREQGVTLIYVSHRMAEIFRVCDAVTVLRDGEVVATRSVAECDENSLVKLMIGRTLDVYFPAHLKRAPAEELLRVEALASPGRFQDVSFTLRAGEVLGLAGLVGAGRTEIAEALFGLDPHVTGQVFLRGQPIRLSSAHNAMTHGFGLVPEDRKRHGLVLSMNARENISLPLLERLRRWGRVDAAAERRLAQNYFDRLRICAPGLETPAVSLSGGNQQKLVIARWLAADCRVLLVDEPTRGVDVGAKAEIHALIDQLAESGAAVLLISSELPEILHLSTRVLVLRHGRIAGEVPRADATQETLMRLMAGVGQVAAMHVGANRETSNAERSTSNIQPGTPA